MRVAIEVGGTCTDLVAINDDDVRFVKVPSTPSKPDEGATNALMHSGIDSAKIMFRAEAFLGGNMPIDIQASRDAFKSIAPGKRDHALVRRDLANWLISKATAKEAFGVTNVSEQRL